MENLCDNIGNLSFEKCLNWMERKGKELFGEGFRIFSQDHELIFKLLAYIFKDLRNCEKLNINPGKGILLTGPVGCGKTSLLNLLRFFLPQEKRYIVKPCRDVSFEFIQEGYCVINRYGRSSYIPDKPKSYCFDDLGTENNLKYYGNDCNVMAEIILSRYDLFVYKKMITHITTNLTSGEIEDIYGTRVRSRMREMFNLMAFDKDSKDKRG